MKNDIVSRLVFLRVDVERILNLRHEILRPGLPFSEASFDGDDEQTTRHYACFSPQDSTELLCCVSYMQRDLDGTVALQLRGMATKKEFAGKGIGSALLQFAETNILQENAPRLLWCNARVESVRFYEKQGWGYISDEFEIPNVGMHRKMVKLL